jgi:hypothetical protein
LTRGTSLVTDHVVNEGNILVVVDCVTDRRLFSLAVQ